MPIYTEGIMADGACILKDGVKMTVSEVLYELNSSAGNVVCDACGNYIEPHEENVGIESNLHKDCCTTQND